MKNFNKLIDTFRMVIKELNYKNIQNNSRLHDEVDYFKAYLSFVDNCIYYSRFTFTINRKTIKGKYLNEKVNRWVKCGIFYKMYQIILNEYLLKNPYTKHLFIDGHIITNKYGIDNKGRCTYYKSKNSYNLQILADDNGSPLALTLNSGNAYEGKLLIELIDNSPIEDGHRYEKSKKYKQYVVADSGYDQSYNHKYIVDKGYTPLIWFNKRNCKDKKKIKERKLGNIKKKHYKKRHIIETLFSWLECKVPRLIKMFDKKIENYLSLAYLASTDILLSKMVRSN